MKSQTFRLVLLLLGIILLLVMCGIGWDILFGTEFILPRAIWPTSDDVYHRVIARIKIGDERSQVIQSLSDAWYHGVCDHSQISIEKYRGYDDIFFYGPQTFEQATLVIVSSRISKVQACVTVIGSFENYML